MKSFKLFYQIFLLFIFLLLFESYINHYHYFFDQIIPLDSSYNTLQKYTKSHREMAEITKLIWSENGLVENIQILFLFFSIIYFFNFLKKNCQLNFRFSKILKYVFFFGIIYYFLEEISWGQHFFQWKSPVIFNQLNGQNETNLHNINNIFNQLPRNLIIIWSSLTFFIVNFKFIQLNQSLSFFIYPSKNLKNISFLIIFFILSREIFQKFFDSAIILETVTIFENNSSNQTFWFEWNGEKLTNDFYIVILVIVDFLKFNFLRYSELQELLFSYYIISHTYYLNKNAIIKKR
jgi:hypothetical protein